MMYPRVPTSIGSALEQLSLELSDIQRQHERLNTVIVSMDAQTIALEDLELCEETMAKLHAMLDEVDTKLKDIRERAERAGLRF